MMGVRFVNRADIEPRFTRLGFTVDRRPIAGSFGAAHLKTARFSYDSGELRSGLADVLAETLGARFDPNDETLLWVYDLVWGDRSREQEPPPEWADYCRWREANGEPRGLYEMPGHVFGTDDHDARLFAVRHALLLGWDALMTDARSRLIVHFSHDDIVTLHARSRPAALIRQLEALGLRPMR